MKLLNKLMAVLAFTLVSLAAHAHHSIAGEYGGAGEPYNYVEGTVIDVAWTNPHISFTVETTDGYFGDGKVVRANSQPTHIISEYGMTADTHQVGDSVKMYGWEHQRGMPLFHLRALGVNDGPIQSTLTFADMWDLVRENTDNGIAWSPQLEGSSPGRLGPEFTQMMKDKGLLNERGRVQLPQ